MTTEIRLFAESDWKDVWPVLQATFATGDTYTFPADAGEQTIRRAWVEVPCATYVAHDPDGILLGTYYIKQNQPGNGSHVSNCGYVVAAAAQGRGVATAMCLHSQERAIALGFRAMQFNFVVATNVRAVRLWERLGFSTFGRVPLAFRHPVQGHVDALIMHKQLVS